MYKLFLDDFRNPQDCAKYMYTRIGPINTIYLEEDWIIARTYDDFEKCFYTYGVPNVISFDHDLADAHYDPSTWTSSFTYKEKTGYDCAKFMIEWCKGHNQYPEQIFVHSMNPVGTENINNLLLTLKHTAM